MPAGAALISGTALVDTQTHPSKCADAPVASRAPASAPCTPRPTNPETQTFADTQTHLWPASRASSLCAMRASISCCAGVGPCGCCCCCCRCSASSARAASASWARVTSKPICACMSSKEACRASP
eukprot:scaffold47094_cov21-Tisochrysis_lutea.AAC.1